MSAFEEEPEKRKFLDKSTQEDPKVLTAYQAIKRKPTTKQTIIFRVFFQSVSINSRVLMDNRSDETEFLKIFENLTC